MEINIKKVKQDEKVMNDTLLSLLDKASEEIAVYRRRQISIFREFAIVQGAITLGISQLSLTNSIAEAAVRIIGGLACLGAGLIGRWIIISYKKRIYFIRDQRLKIVGKFPGLDKVCLFYPTNEEEPLAEYQTQPTSQIYGSTLVALGALILVVNFVAAFL